MKPFRAAQKGDWFVSRTGYTGEDGFEIVYPAAEAPALWQSLLKTGVAPCGPGARDTLRLEAGLNLCGQDMDETVSPLESRLAWRPADRDFIGCNALEAQRERGRLRHLVGLLPTGREVLRRHQKVFLFDSDEPVGEITSGGYRSLNSAPTLQRSIALARVAPDIGEKCRVSIRGQAVPARIVKPPFVRNGKPLVEL